MRVVAPRAQEGHVRADEGVAEILRPCYAQGVGLSRGQVVAEGAGVLACVVHVAEARGGDGGVGYLVAFGDGDAGAEKGVRAGVVRGAVDGVEEPGAARGRDATAALLR